jgi:5-methylcytosine-specific restriction endonuclease McrA
LQDDYGRRRGHEGQYSYLYRTKRWRAIREQQLREHPLCEICLKAGKIEPATVCDHIEPHKGNMDKFWSGPFQSLSEHCHNSVKKLLENGRTGCSESGIPLDPGHFWNKE